MSAVRALVRKYLPDLIYGANDVTTLAVVSGVVGASLSSTVILVLGFANLLADGISMGASNVLSRRSETRAAQLPSLRHSAQYGLATFLGFVVAGFVPLLAYLLPIARGALQAGLEMLAIGSAAAGLAYLIGAAAGSILGATG